MTRSRVFVLVVLAAATTSGCSKAAPAKLDSDSASPRADSVTAAAIAASPVPAGTTPATGAPPAASKPAAPAPPTASKEAPKPPTLGTRPHLIKLTPASGSIEGGAVVVVEITADRLTATGNTVHFGSVKVGEVASADGKTVKFTVPENIPSRSEVPPMKMQPGRYAVYIVNANGTSDTLTFTLKDQ